MARNRSIYAAENDTKVSPMPRRGAQPIEPSDVRGEESRQDPFRLDVASVRLVMDAPIFSESRLDNPEDVTALLGSIMCEFDREVIGVVNLKATRVPINVTFASVGTLNQAIAHPRELLKGSILSNAYGILLIHNHPSGDLSPSREDTLLTDRMNRVCMLMGFEFVDHMIVGGDNREFFSYKEKGMIENPHIMLTTDYRSLDLGTPMAAERKGR